METKTEYVTEDDRYEVRDNRTEKRFFIDNAIIQDYGPKIGVYGIAVYSALCMHSKPSTQRCWPSHRTIAEEIGCSPPKVKEALRQLETLKLIRVEPHFDAKTGRQTSNTYTLLDPPPVTDTPDTTDTRPQYHDRSTMNNPKNEQSQEEHGADAQHAADLALFGGDEKPTTNPATERVQRMRAKFGDDPILIGGVTAQARQEQTLRTTPEENIPTGDSKAPAVLEFKRATGYMPPKPWRAKIIQYVGDKPNDLQRWYAVCDAWVGCGWNPRNAKGMIDFYILEQIPGSTHGGRPMNSTNRDPNVAYSSDMVVM